MINLNVFMGTITINVDDEIETRFRELVKQEIGTGKGSLGSAVENAFELWVSQKEENTIAERELQLLRRGFRLGKYTFNREELP